MEVPYHRFNRWRKRVHSSLPVLTVPGPKKTQPFDPAELRNEIRSLPHGPHRSCGTGRLFGRYCFRVSRREFNDLVARVRFELRQEKRRALLRVKWLVPGMVWAMDGTMFRGNGVLRDAELMTTREMRSKYLFKPLCTMWTPSSTEVGAYLSYLFWLHGAPLFAKLDLGGNLRGEEVLMALAENWVYPLFSPPEYPGYNGSVENVQGDIKGEIRRLLPLENNATETEFDLCSQLAAHNLNHQPRRVLDGKTACQVLGGGVNPLRVTIPERREVYDWLNDTSESILSLLEEGDSQRAKATAKRRAAEMWLSKNNVIKLTKDGESVTLF